MKFIGGVLQSMRFLRLGLLAGLILTMNAAASIALARGPQPPGATPEIDPGSLASAFAILLGGTLVLTDRLRRK